MITVQNSVPNPVVEEAVLFPFDTYSCPFSAGLRLQLIPGKIPGRGNPIVVATGEPGAPDDFCTPLLRHRHTDRRRAAHVVPGQEHS